ncbi:hypothetical protein BU23DRAFT_29335 [Bimuria novae-zelandiae CBS 107.79]|uniref:Uncharacterized protein n=1 Tax=Bimuria novae-zelandiae CBS 107.79 TaxID=1447943 RepID=A0A6A5VIU4_9PLEO|nr:hypothetical protein BU23DRAFT_29335 [Bimuria novae-zelandiae CBS 107.79]
MRTSLAIFALLSAIPALAVAYPASGTYGSGPVDDTPSASPTYGSGSGSSSGSGSVAVPDVSNEGACTLYKAQQLKGSLSTTDYTFVPAGSGCLDLTSLFGIWEDKTRSLVVQEGYKCEYFTEFQCTSEPLCLNASDKKIIKKTLPAAFDKKIKSVKCEKVEAEKPKPQPKPQPTTQPTPEPYTPPSSSY